jgi:hypothetical protein
MCAIIDANARVARGKGYFHVRLYAPSGAFAARLIYQLQARSTD